MGYQVRISPLVRPRLNFGYLAQFKNYSNLERLNPQQWTPATKTIVLDLLYPEAMYLQPGRCTAEQLKATWGVRGKGCPATFPAAEETAVV